LTKLHATTVPLDDPQALADFLTTIPNSGGLAALLTSGEPQNTRAYDDDSQIARFVISNGSIATCFTVADITIDQAEMITLACEETDEWDEESFQRAISRVLGTGS
jgi:hypothetical protein